MKRDWTPGMVCVALCAAVVAAGAVWLMWTADPVLTLLAGIWAATTGLCVLASTRNLRARLEATQQVVDAWNSSEARDELAQSPPAGTKAVYDQDAEHEWVDITSGVASVEIAPGRPYDHTGDPAWTNVGAGPEDIQFSGPPELIGYPLPEATRATVQKYLPGWPMGQPMTATETDRLMEQLQALPGEDVSTPDPTPLPITGDQVFTVDIEPEFTAITADDVIAALPDGSLTVNGTFTNPDEWHIGQACAHCDGPDEQPATTWISDRPHPGLNEVTFLCDDHYAAAMAEGTDDE